MISFYVPHKLEGKAVHFLLDSKREKSGVLFQSLASYRLDQLYKVVSDPAEADMILIPHNYFDIKGHVFYIKKIVDLAEKNNKKILIFAYGDSSDVVSIPYSVVVRTSVYRKTRGLNEIIMPPYVEDLGAAVDLTVRVKQDMPTVGFVGWAKCASYRQALKLFLSVMYFEVLARILRADDYRDYIQGIYFRKKIIGILSKSKLIKPNFLVRSSYSGHKKTIGPNPKQRRNEYVSNIINSDFILAPKGDGNYSLRFYETLSLGRIPVIIDTGTVLPSEDSIDYNSFSVRIHRRDMNNIENILTLFYRKISNEGFRAMQNEARNIFETRLNIRSYLSDLFLYLQKKYGKHE